MIKSWITKNRNIISVCAICLFGLLMRLINLGTEPYWLDEVLSVDVTRHYLGNIPAMLAYLRVVDFQAPLYYILLQGWIQLFGFSEFVVRLISVIFGVGSIIAVYWFTKELFKNYFISMVAALFVAILPIQIEYSQEARPYIVFQFFGIIAAIFLWKYLLNQKKLNLPWYILANIIGLYLHFSYLLYLVPLSLYWLIYIIVWGVEKTKWISFKIWLYVNGAIVFLFLPWLDVFLFKLQVGMPLGMLTVHNSPFRPLSFFANTINRLLWLPIDMQHISQFEIFCVAIFKLIFIFSALSILYEKSEFIREKFNLYYRELSLVFWMIVFSLGMFLFSPQSYNYTTIIERHVILVSIFLIVLLASLIFVLDRKRRYLLMVIFLISIFSFSFQVIQDDSTWDPEHRFKFFADYVNQEFRPGDLVITNIPYSRVLLNHYLRSDITAWSVIPVDVYDDFLSSRNTLGQWGMIWMDAGDMSSRITSQGSGNRVDLQKKISYIMKKNNPKRVISILLDDELVEEWFIKNGWKHRFWSLGEMFPINTYEINLLIRLQGSNLITK